ncbi:MAG: CHAT domain-containing tetratricopeptide repeat protein [Caldilineaceae bacterium]
MIDESITPDWIENLIGAPTAAEQSALLRAADLAGEMGLTRLLDETEQLARRNPGQARQLAALCEQMAVAQGVNAIVPRARYLRAQTLAIHGEFEEALALIHSAHTKFIALGMTLDALRTQVGRMNVLIQLGRFPEALDVAAQVLQELPAAGPPSPELQLLTALINDSRGTAYGETGRYEEALRAYGQAEAIYAELEMPERLAVAVGNRGLILRYLGRIGDALAAYTEAARLAAASEHIQGYMLTNIGEAHLLLGQYTQGLHAFQKAAVLLAKVGALSDQQANLLHMADAYRMLNLYPEALTAYREAEAGFQQSNLIYERAMALWGMGSTLAAQNQLAPANAPLAQAAALFREAGNRPLRSGVLLEQAAVKAAEDERLAALALADEALQLVSAAENERDAWPVQRVYAHLRLADLQLPNIAAASTHLSQAERLLEPLTLPQLRYRWQRRMGHLHLLQGELDAAQCLLEAAIAAIEEQRSTVTHEAMRTSFLHDKTAAYTDLVQVHLARGQVADAFDVVERAKSRALVERMSSLGPVGKKAAVNVEMEQRWQQLQADLSAVYSELLSNGGETLEIGNALDRAAKLNARALALEQEISLLRLHVVDDDPRHRPVGAPAKAPQIADQLPAQTVLLSYYILDNEIVVFVMANGAMQVVRDLASVTHIEQLLQKLHAQWDRFRAGAAFVQRHMPILERTANHILGEFYKALIAPLEQMLPAAVAGDSTAPRLLIVPHGLLHQLPFHAFYDGVGHLLERFEIAYAPSAAIWRICQEQPNRPTAAALIMGAPDPNIPAVEAEVQAVARHFPAAQVYVGTEATRPVLLESAAEVGLLHLACHGLFRADNPLFSALKLHDGWLNAAELAQLNLRGARVVLSACESGRSRVLGGDELIGLARAALSAGASTLVVSQWLVHDDAGARLMAAWYAALAQNQSPAAALRTAQLTVKAEQSHPYYWAAFVLLGRG